MTRSFGILYKLIYFHWENGQICIFFHSRKVRKNHHQSNQCIYISYTKMITKDWVFFQDLWLYCTKQPPDVVSHHVLVILSLLTSFSRISWWKRSSCSSEYAPMFYSDLSRWVSSIWTLREILQPMLSWFFFRISTRSLTYHEKMLFQAATFLIVSFLGEFIALQDRLDLRLKFWRSRSWWLLTLFLELWEIFIRSNMMCGGDINTSLETHQERHHSEVSGKAPSCTSGRTLWDLGH